MRIFPTFETTAKQRFTSVYFGSGSYTTWDFLGFSYWRVGTYWSETSTWLGWRVA